ncbi:MAG: DUF5829 family protein [Spirosomataceae bacterium]
MVSLQVLLNHFYLTLDAPTFDAIVQCDFMRNQFAPNEIRTTRRTDRSYTGLYFYGEKTYFEFFDVTTESNRKVGDSAIAFGLESEGETTLLEEQWPQSTRLTITRPMQENQVHWFDMLIPAGFSLESSIAVWTMEYLPRFLQQWQPQIGTAVLSKSELTARQTVLTRYKSLLTPVENPVLRNVIGLTLWAPPAVYGAFEKFAEDFGYAKNATETGFSFTDSEEVTYHIHLSYSDLYGITEVVFEVNSLPSQQTWELGNSTLRFLEEGKAVWSFVRKEK